MRLDDACSAIVDCEHKTAPITPGGKYYAVGTPAMQGNAIDYSQAREISRDTFDQWTQRLVPESGDLLFAREAPVGPIVRIPSSLNVAPGQRTVLLRPKPSVTDSSYLYYRMISPVVQRRISEVSMGSTVAHLNVADIRSLDIDIPPLPEQQAIAEVLGALDDKIAANRNLRSTIRSFGSTITQRTTLTSGVPATIDDIAMFSNRKRIPLSASQRELRPGTVPYWGANGRMGWVDEPIFNEQLVLVGEDGSVVTDAGTPVIHNVWGPCWVNNHAHVLTGTSVSTDLLYFLMRSAQIAAKVTGAVQPKLSMTNLKSVELRIPAKEDLGTLEATIQPLMARYRQAAEESQTLASLRDTLLPALMDGTIRVKDAERLTEEAV